MKKAIPCLENSILWKALTQIMSIILIVCGGCLVLLVGVNVFLRYVLKTSYAGIDDVLLLLSIWLYWIGGAYGSYEDSHISGNLTNLIIKNQRTRQYVNIVVRLITTIVSGVFAYWSIFEYALWNIQAGTVTTGIRLPHIVINIALTIGICLMFLYSLYHLLVSIVTSLYVLKDNSRG